MGGAPKPPSEPGHPEFQAPTFRQQPPPPKSAPALVGAMTARELLNKLKARHGEVKREIRKLKALEAEKAQLERLIRAAKTEVDNVRRLRAAG